MMARADFTLTGDKRLAAQLRDIDRAVRGKVLLRALVSGGLLIVNEAKRLAPYETGNLRRSLHVGGEGSSGGLEGDTTGTDIGGQASGRDWAEISVGTNVEYAARREFGFAGADSRGRVYHDPATPYLRPALESEKAAAQKEIGNAVRAQLRKVVR
jgi:phage gpG-like protein